ncbi:MAG TPA: glycosyltransferase family 1 protein [Burkholderiales bacterium]|nr:glycosyltransferase family 1 protein [Burkholderiales bacterium]
MIRVGFAPSLDTGWIGGLNYYRNLFEALAETPDPSIELALFAGARTDLGWLPPALRLRVVRSSLLERGTAANVARRALRRLSGRDILLANLTRSVDVLSHSGPLRGMRRPRTMGWLADLQHRHLPQFFSEAERHIREQIVLDHLRECAVVLVSSEAARGDLLHYAEAASARIVVLRFVATPLGSAQRPDKAALRAKYALADRYFYLPNQFWAHKNHRVVVDALRAVRGAGIQVVCTGDIRDYRHPGHYAQLTAAAEGLGDAFRVLGLVPLPDATALMRDCVAVINPSLFEGWSTTVEEAKSLGKRVLLSDLPVHREQAPGRGRFFDPRDPQDVARAMEEALEAHDPGEEAREAEAATARLPERRGAFARAYLEAVRMAAG